MSAIDPGTGTSMREISHPPRLRGLARIPSCLVSRVGSASPWRLHLHLFDRFAPPLWSSFSWPLFPPTLSSFCCCPLYTASVPGRDTPRFRPGHRVEIYSGQLYPYRSTFACLGNSHISSSCCDPLAHPYQLQFCHREPPHCMFDRRYRYRARIAWSRVRHRRPV